MNMPELLLRGSKLNLIFNIFLFIIGILLGSFFTLATYRLPKKQDILYTRSYCPKCKHRLNFLDLIPVISYIALSGRCRYCKEKISIRYIMIELCSGILYLLFVNSFNFNFLNLDINKVCFLIIATIFYSLCFIIIEINSEKQKISRYMAYIFYVVSIINMVYVYILKLYIYTYAIFGICIILSSIAILQNVLRYKYEKNNV